jgi:hypothetical protein
MRLYLNALSSFVKFSSHTELNEAIVSPTSSWRTSRESFPALLARKCICVLVFPLYSSLEDLVSNCKSSLHPTKKKRSSHGRMKFMYATHLSISGNPCTHLASASSSNSFLVNTNTENGVARLIILLKYSGHPGTSPLRVRNSMTSFLSSRTFPVVNIKGSAASKIVWVSMHWANIWSTI